MKIWEAILYAFFGGAAELLPISFAGHAALLQNAFNLSPLSEGGGYYVHAAICLGVMAAIFLSFRGETRTLKNEILLMTGLKRLRRGAHPNRVLRRSILLGFFALIPMLLSLIFTAKAERISGMALIALFFALNGALLFLCCRGTPGRKTEKNVLLSDTLLIGLTRCVSVFPGLSSVGSSMCIGRARGLSLRYNLRLAYLLTLVYQMALFLYRLIRAVAFGHFSAGIVPPVVLAALFSAVAGYLAIQYFRYLLQRQKLYAFSYYCWGAAMLALILLLINA